MIEWKVLEKVIKSNIKLNNVCTLSDSTVYEQCTNVSTQDSEPYCLKTVRNFSRVR
jgi:hypothetical protein